MNFSLEQKLAVLFFILGVVAGFASNYLANLLFSLAAGVAIYAASFSVLAGKIKSKKTKWLVTNSLVTFVLVWLVVWIFLFNMG